MEKPKKLVVSRGVRSLGLEPMLLQQLFRKAVSFYPKHHRVVFEPRDDDLTFVFNIGMRKLDVIRKELPEQVCILASDCGDHDLFKAVLSQEI